MKFLAFLTLSTAVACAQNGLSFETADGNYHLDILPSLEAVLWSGDTPAPALLGETDQNFFAPRFSLAMDASAGGHLFLHATTRVDRGFDPGAEADGQVRLDIVTLRWRVFDDPSLNFQFGKFPTAFGAWPGQSDFFNDPFLLAPLPYSQIIGINTLNLAAMSPAAISARANGTAAAVSTLSKDAWASTIWGPSYGTGVRVFGLTEHVDYALEIKGTALSSHPDSWSEVDFSNPSLTGRFGYRPDAAWAFGISASRGPWLEDGAMGSLPAGVDQNDLIQNTLGLDVRWAHHQLILSGEIVLSEFETPAAGDLRTASWFVQARWKVSPGFWLSTRFGQVIANDATGATGSDVSWQPDIWRAEIGSGWRITSNLLLKASYSFTHTGGDDLAGEHLLGTGIGWKF